MSWAFSIATLHAAVNPQLAEPSDCDRLASHPNDPFRAAPGVSLNDLNAANALTACEMAINQRSRESRLLFLRGRVHERIARLTDDAAKAKASYALAVADYETAKADGYSMAFSNLSAAYQEGHGVEIDLDRATGLRLEMLNRVLACCWVPVARHLLAEESKYDKAKIRRIVSELTRWSAALGSADAKALLVELTANGTMSPADPLPPATFTDLPPWFRDKP